MPKNIELVDVYPVEDPRNLPIKTLYLGRGNIFVLGDIEPEHIHNLADVQAQQRESGLYEAHVKLSVWEDSGYARSLDRQLFIGDMQPDSELKGKLVHVFDPYDVRLWTLTEPMLEEYANENCYFWQVARYLGVNRIVADYDLSPDNIKPEVQYNGLKKLQKPKRSGFGISRKADTQIGNLDYNVVVGK